MTSPEERITAHGEYYKFIYTNLSFVLRDKFSVLVVNYSKIIV